jgi:hypothetical protein
MIVGGIHIDPATDQVTLLNDVWTNFYENWQPSTLRAPWSPRAEHLVLITENTKLGRDIIYVLGGMIAVDGARNTNDVSSQSSHAHIITCHRSFILTLLFTD